MMQLGRFQHAAAEIGDLYSLYSCIDMYGQIRRVVRISVQLRGKVRIGVRNMFVQLCSRPQICKEVF